MFRSSVVLLLLLGACHHDDSDTDGGTDTDLAGDGKLRFTILHTNDTHSHMLGIGTNASYTPGETGDDTTLGGRARMKALVDEIRDGSPDPVVLFDAGDWISGTLFQELRTTESAELQMMQLMGYDAIILGNHEFDWGPQVLGQIITAGDDNGVTVPIIATNTVPNPDDDGDDLLEAHFDSGRIEHTKVLTLDNGLTLGLFGLVGDSAATITPAVTPSSFHPTAEASEEAVLELEYQGVDVVIAISHSGETEDQEIAEAVPGIDIIVGGHSHMLLEQAIVKNGTTIVQAGYYGKWLGEIDVAVAPDSGEVEVENYEVHPIDDTILGDSAVTEKLTGFITDLEADSVLSDLGFAFDEPMVEVPGSIAYQECTETGLGDFITDAYRMAVTAVSDDPVDFAFESQGVIRETLYEGNDGVEAFSDLFEVLPLGSGTDGRPGYGLVHFYITGAEVRDACEVTATIAPEFGCNYWIEIGGLRCTMNMSMPSPGRVTKVERLTDEDEWETVSTSSSNTELYHVTVDSYVASLMSLLETLSSGALEVTPKDIDGNVLTSVTDMLVDQDSGTEGIQELKLWEALMNYADTFPDADEDGIPELPEAYLAAEGRVIGYENP